MWYELICSVWFGNNCVVYRTQSVLIDCIGLCVVYRTQSESTAISDNLILIYHDATEEEVQPVHWTPAQTAGAQGPARLKPETSTVISD